jgi:hypothetical protein
MAPLNVDKTQAVRFANKEKTLIDLFVILPGRGSCAYTAAKGEELFGQAISGMFGPIQSWTPPAVDVRAKQHEIYAEFQRRIGLALQGKSASMLREAMFLQTLTELTDDQKLELQVFKDINAWETAMVDRREELIERNDTVAAKNDTTWPKFPASATDAFMKGF